MASRYSDQSCSLFYLLSRQILLYSRFWRKLNKNVILKTGSGLHPRLDAEYIHAYTRPPSTPTPTHAENTHAEYTHAEYAHCCTRRVQTRREHPRLHAEYTHAYTPSTPTTYTRRVHTRPVHPRLLHTRRVHPKPSTHFVFSGDFCFTAPPLSRIGSSKECTFYYTKTPPNPLYAVLGQELRLHWEYYCSDPRCPELYAVVFGVPGRYFVFRDIPSGRINMFPFSGQNETIDNQYKGRVTLLGNNTMVILPFKPTDVVTFISKLLSHDGKIIQESLVTVKVHQQQTKPQMRQSQKPAVNRLYRSWYFTSNPDHCLSSSRPRADVVVLDMEDGTPVHLKTSTRREIAKMLNSDASKHPRLFVRLNPLENQHELLKDLSSLVLPPVAGFVLPKVQDSLSLREFDKLIAAAERRIGLSEGSRKLVPIMETTNAFFQAESIAKGSRRVIGLLTGMADFKAECHCDESSPTYFTFLSHVVMACRAADVLPVAGVCEKLDDHIAAERFYSQMKACGFVGSAVLTPTQVVHANISYSPSTQEAKWASEVLKGSVSKELDSDINAP
ncbi:predicted protein [Nematostella vectensis]|uniref:HpcH/HpaI aldolase/citrate lyase domain-containing protein n=1 Tax=Nematostella vectensis TaxID=45351 RepID=A7SS34_NEMVE|nr:predicted protein [Nematostella vectensis]|eukprot:XP_001625595.1 predicted protein [Nematostella vectensis]